MQIYQLFTDMQTKTQVSARLPGLVLDLDTRHPMEPLPDAALLLRRQAWSMVRHPHHCLVLYHLQPYRYWLIGRRVFEPITQVVAQNLAEPVRVRLHPDERSIPVHQLNGPVEGHHLLSGDLLAHQGAQVTAGQLQLQRAAARPGDVEE